MAKGLRLFLEGLVSVLILGGMVWSCVSHRQREAPHWSAGPASAMPSGIRSAVLEFLHSQTWAQGDEFDLLQASVVRADFDRFGPDKDLPVSVVLVEYVRRLKDPHEFSAAASPEQFAFVIGPNGQVIRRLPVDGRHKPYADLFGL